MELTKGFETAVHKPMGDITVTTSAYYIQSAVLQSAALHFGTRDGFIHSAEKTVGGRGSILPLEMGSRDNMFQSSLTQVNRGGEGEGKRDSGGSR